MIVKLCFICLFFLQKIKEQDTSFKPLVIIKKIKISLSLNGYISSKSTVPKKKNF